MPIHMRLPKLKGFNNAFRTEYQVVNVAALAGLFPRGGPVDVDALVAAGAVRKGAPVKVLGHGELGSVKLHITANAFSSTARDKIEAAGGTVTEL
jgi:large subunit ribosomal protein L15